MLLLSPPILERMRVIFGEGFDIQLKLIVGFAVAQLLATLLMWTSQVIDPAQQSSR